MIKSNTDILATDFILTTTAGEALSARDAVYISTADGKAYKCDADDLTKMDFAGFAQEAAILNASVNIINNGVATGFSGLTTGARYYISGTAGGITTTPPTNVTNVGVALSATVIRMDKFPTQRVVSFTSSGTWTKRPGLKYAIVEVQAAGGGGGGADLGSSGEHSGGGGGAGGYSRKLIAAINLGSTETVTIGTGGTSSTAGDGTSGGSSSFGTHATATGGGGGLNEMGVAGAGGVGSSGDLNIQGQPGEGRGGIGGVWGTGNGGASFFLGGGAGGYQSSGSNGSLGGGGGGGNTSSGGTATAGGSGGNGIVLVTEYY